MSEPKHQIRFDGFMPAEDLFHDVPDPLSVQELATIWRVNRNTVLQLIADGHLDAFRVGRNWRIRRASAFEYMVRMSARTGNADVSDTE